MVILTVLPSELGSVLTFAVGVEGAPGSTLFAGRKTAQDTMPTNTRAAAAIQRMFLFIAPHLSRSIIRNPLFHPALILMAP